MQGVEYFILRLIVRRKRDMNTEIIYAHKHLFLWIRCKICVDDGHQEMFALVTEINTCAMYEHFRISFFNTLEVSCS